MSMTDELYQQVILEHNRKPHNFGPLESCTHHAEGFNPVCGDHYTVYMNIDSDGNITKASFDGAGCAISKASASMMTQSLIGKTKAEADTLFQDFHKLVTGTLNPDTDQHVLGKLAVFSGIWKYPARVKCAALSWHAMHTALEGGDMISTE